MQSANHYQSPVWLTPRCLAGVNGLCTILIHAESGEYLMDTFIMPVSKQNDPQAVGSAITYAKRYALAGVLGLI
jgi:hypothetical protein